MEIYTTLNGVSFRPSEAREIVKTLDAGYNLALLREPGNKYDPLAIQVIDPLSEIHLGYVARGDAAGLAPAMDAGRIFHCQVFSPEERKPLLVISDDPFRSPD